MQGRIRGVEGGFWGTGVDARTGSELRTQLDVGVFKLTKMHCVGVGRKKRSCYLGDVKLAIIIAWVRKWR